MRQEVIPAILRHDAKLSNETINRLQNENKQTNKQTNKQKKTETKTTREIKTIL